MRITTISPYNGGSHQAWAEGIRDHSQHQIDLLTLPARFWKWRMHGGAVTLARRFLESYKQPDLLLATDMLDLTTFLALTRKRTRDIPAIMYMHENQLTYPLPRDGSTGPMRRQLGERDRHYAFINYVSMMAADCVLFNSEYHLTSYFEALPTFLGHFPEYKELVTLEDLHAKSEVLHVGIDLCRLDSADQKSKLEQPPNAVPLILWNQRWEYDKNPGDFFAALSRLADEGIKFQIALCGQQYGQRPSSFDLGIEQLSDRIVHTGYASQERYAQLLWNADIVVSTAYHEFFGISIIEAIYAKTFPILPNRLSYPELLRPEAHDHCLYDSQGGLLERLRWATTHLGTARSLADKWSRDMDRYDWLQLGPEYDRLLVRCIA